jgi:hypothetical protein
MVRPYRRGDLVKRIILKRLLRLAAMVLVVGIPALAGGGSTSNFSVVATRKATRWRGDSP